MQGKRQASYNINQKTLEAVQKDNQQANVLVNEGKQQQRVIHKIKKYVDQPKKEKQHKKQDVNGFDIKIVQQKQAEKDQKKAQIGFNFANISNNQNGVGLFSLSNESKTDSNTNTPKLNLSSASLFTGNGYSLPKPKTQSLFNNPNSINPITEPLNLTKNNPSFFAGNGYILPKPITQPKNTPITEPLAINKPNPLFFAGNGHNFHKPTSSAVSNTQNNQNKKSFLFGDIQIKGTSIFSNQSSEKKSSIFGFSSGISLPPVRVGGGEEDQQGDSAELQKVQQMKIDRTKSKGNYQYKQEVKILVSGVAKKFKKNNGELIQNVEALVEQDEKTGLTMLVVRLMATKNTIFSGLIIKGKSQVRVINRKEQNIEVTTMSIPKQKNQVAQKDKIKLQLQTSELGKQFYSKIDGAINKQQNIQLKKQQKPQIKQQQKVEDIKKQQKIDNNNNNSKQQDNNEKQ